MERMNCDIIQDLIPSYIDGISSDATNKCVEEHISECNQCRSLVQLYRDTEISNYNIEQKQIDVFKKFNRQLRFINLFSMVLVLIPIGLGIYTFCNNYISFSINIYYILFPICMIILYLFAHNNHDMKSPEKRDYIVAMFSTIDTACAIGFIMYVVNCVKNGRTIFSLDNSQIGPFVNSVCGILFLILGIGSVYIFFRMIWKNINSKNIICLQMIEMFLLLSYITLIRNFTSINDFYRLFTQTTLVIGTMGLVVFILFKLIEQKSKSH